MFIPGKDQIKIVLPLQKIIQMPKVKNNPKKSGVFHPIPPNTHPTEPAPGKIKCFSKCPCTHNNWVIHPKEAHSSAPQQLHCHTWNFSATLIPADPLDHTPFGTPFGMQICFRISGHVHRCFWGMFQGYVGVFLEIAILVKKSEGRFVECFCFGSIVVVESDNDQVNQRQKAAENRGVIKRHMFRSGRYGITLGD